MGKDLKGKELGRGYSQRPDGRYEARATVNGVKIDLYNKSLQQLKQKFEYERNKLKSGLFSEHPTMTLEEWYDQWFKVYKAPQLKSEVAAKSYDRKLRNTYVRILGEKRIADITIEDIQNATNEISNGYTKRGAKEALNILRKCLDTAVSNRIITVSPVSDNIVIGQDYTPPQERRVLSHWEQDLFLAETEDSYYREAYRILLLTGMRIGEFSGLQWRDIDFTNKRIKIRRSMVTAYQDGKKIEKLAEPKTVTSYRSIPFFGSVEEYFKTWSQKQDRYKLKLGGRWRADAEFGDLVFTTTLGSPVTRYNLVHDIQRVERNIQAKEYDQYFDHIYPHAFRHTFATRCFEKGLDPLFIQRIMGHANYSTTISYTHILAGKEAEEVAKAGDLLN